MIHAVVFCMQLETKPLCKSQYKKRHLGFFRVLNCIPEISRNFWKRSPTVQSQSSWECPLLCGGKTLRFKLVSRKIPKSFIRILKLVFQVIWDSLTDCVNLDWQTCCMMLYNCALLASRARHRLMLGRYWQIQFRLPILYVK